MLYTIGSLCNIYIYTHTNNGYGWAMEAPDCPMFIVISINPTTGDKNIEYIVNILCGATSNTYKHSVP